MKGSRGQRGRSQSNLKSKKQKREVFDQEQENFDALQMGDHEDREYDKLLKSTSPHTNNKKNAYFFNNDKYKGTKQAKEESEPEEDSMSQESEQQNQIANALKSFKQEKKKESKLLTQDVRQIDQEDEQFEALRKKIKTSQQTLEEAINLRNQLNLQNMLIDFRYNEQNTLEALKKFPSSNFPHNQELHSLQKEFQSSVFANLNKLIEAYSTYSQKVLETVPLDTYEQEYETQIGQSQGMKVDGPSIHTQFSQKEEEIVRGTEKELIKWSNKTNLINVSSSHYSSLLMQTPIGQAKKILSNWDRVKSKCQQKRGTFRVLFQNEQNVRNSTDPQIFDDFQLFAEFERNFISNIQDEADFRISDTMRYLRNRQQNSREKTKEVDRKASKNRKLRFNAHSKLLNFMPCYPGNLMEARDEIVENFFNCKAGSVPENRSGNDQTYYIDL